MTMFVGPASLHMQSTYMFSCLFNYNLNQWSRLVSCHSPSVTKSPWHQDDRQVELLTAYLYIVMMALTRQTGDTGEILELMTR